MRQFVGCRIDEVRRMPKYDRGVSLVTLWASQATASITDNLIIL